MTIDLNAPIVPDHSAAGIQIGSSIFDLLQTDSPRITESRGGSVLHDFGIVKVWSVQGAIKQVGVYEGYRGTLTNGIGIGKTLAEIEQAFCAVVQEDDEDNLIVIGHPGWCFETETWRGHTLAQNRDARLNAIFVFGTI